MAHHRNEPFRVSQSGTRSPRVRWRCMRSYAPRLGSLEARTLLAGAFPDVAGDAMPLALDSPVAATIAPLAAVYYQISLEVGGKLTVLIQSPGFAARSRSSMIRGSRLFKVTTRRPEPVMASSI